MDTQQLPKLTLREIVFCFILFGVIITELIVFGYTVGHKYLLGEAGTLIYTPTSCISFVVGVMARDIFDHFSMRKP